MQVSWDPKTTSFTVVCAWTQNTSQSPCAPAGLNGQLPITTPWCCDWSVKINTGQSQLRRATCLRKGAERRPERDKGHLGMFSSARGHLNSHKLVLHYVIGTVRPPNGAWLRWVYKVLIRGEAMQVPGRSCDSENREFFCWITSCKWRFRALPYPSLSFSHSPKQR